MIIHLKCVSDLSEKRYNDKNIARLSEGTTCNASREPDNHWCTNVMDGNMYTRWASSINDNVQYIRLMFDSVYVLERLDIYHSCKRTTQCQTMQITFSSGRQMVVNSNSISTITLRLPSPKRNKINKSKLPRRCISFTSTPLQTLSFILAFVYMMLLMKIIQF